MSHTRKGMRDHDVSYQDRITSPELIFGNSQQFLMSSIAISKMSKRTTNHTYEHLLQASVLDFLREKEIKTDSTGVLI